MWKKWLKWSAKQWNKSRKVIKKNPAGRRDFLFSNWSLLTKAEKIAVVDKENTQEDNAFTFADFAVIGGKNKE